MQKVVVIRPLLKRKTLDPRIIGTDHPGTYRWWFHESCLKDLGLSENGSYVLKSGMINGEKYYALYFGIAVKETIRERFNWHINQSHSYSNIRSGTISTLRHSLSALLLRKGPCQKNALPEGIRVFSVNEDGASVYSTSDTAREEFPEYDVMVSGAVSIDQMLMEPLPKQVKTILSSERLVNDFIDANCIVEWMPYPIGTESQIHIDELKELSQFYWYPLNIQDNKKKDTVKLDYYKNLKRLRSEFKKEFICSV